MIPVGSRKAWFTGGWILVSALVVAYNAFSLSALFDSTLVGYSEEVKLASNKWRRYEERKARTGKMIQSNELSCVIEKLSPVSKAPEENGPPAQHKESERAKSVLPALSGIVELCDVMGNRRMYAVINGETHAEGARVQDYTIDTITKEAVVFLKYGRKYFVPKPEIYYSIDQSGSR